MPTDNPTAAPTKNPIKNPSNYPWRRVLKINRGVSIPGSQTPAQWYEAYTEYSYANMTSEEVYINAPQGTSLTIDSNFKSRLIKDWADKTIIVNKVRLLFCRNGNIEKEVVFNATTSTYNNWLTPHKIEASSYIDMTPSMSYSANYVGIAIPSWPDRTFGFWKSAPSCEGDEAWFVVTVANICGDTGEWGETEFTPNIKYSGLDTAGVFQTDGVTGETFIMEILINQPTTSTEPTAVPSFIPTVNPTYVPTTNPTYIPTTDPSTVPWFIPTVNPTNYPTNAPSKYPTISPSKSPTHNPTEQQTYDTMNPTNHMHQTLTTGKVQESNVSATTDNLGIIIGSIIGVIALIVLIILLIFVTNNKQNKQKSKNDEIYSMASISMSPTHEMN
eukprot:257853_1